MSYFQTWSFGTMIEMTLLKWSYPEYTKASFFLNYFEMLPYLVDTLSEKYPMRGVAIPSATWPTTIMVVADGVYTMRLR